jgi:two-component system response regulator FlrC
VILMTAYGQIDRAVQAMRDGAADYLPKPFEPDRLAGHGGTIFPPGGRSPAVWASWRKMATSAALLELARRVAASEASVLLTGESGVGKEVFARYIHQHSARHKGPFVAVNCAAIPENLLESVLFGHEKGAFTGATAAQPGKFEQANGGILLLDEISELPLNLQAKLLRVLQEREVERVGGRNAIPLDAASSPPRTATWPAGCGKAGFARTCITGSMFSPWKFRRCETAAPTSPPSPATS